MPSLLHAARTGWRRGGLFRLDTEAGRVPYRVVRADRPPGRRPALVVGLHGFGSDEGQVATMLPLDRSDVVYLAPRAPLPEGAGFSWFDLRLGADGQPVPEAGGVRAALDHLGAFARAAASVWETDPARTALVGYSQGGALALAAALDASGPFHAVASIAGGLPESETLTPHAPLFVGMGTLDPFVRPEAVRRQVAAWTDAGADVTLSEAEAPHVVAARHRSDLDAWLARHL